MGKWHDQGLNDKVRSFFDQEAGLTEEEQLGISKRLVELAANNEGFDMVAVVDQMKKDSEVDPAVAYKSLSGKSVVNKDNLREILSQRMKNTIEEK